MFKFPHFFYFLVCLAPTEKFGHSWGYTDNHKKSYLAGLEDCLLCHLSREFVLRYSRILQDLSVSFSQIDGFKTSPWGATHTLLSTPSPPPPPPPLYSLPQTPSQPRQPSTISHPHTYNLYTLRQKNSKLPSFSIFYILKMLSRIRCSIRSIIHFIDLKRWRDKIRPRLEFFLCKGRQCGLIRLLL